MGGVPPSEWDVVYRRDPIGIIGLISDWNYPLYVAFRKVAPDLVAGRIIPVDIGIQPDIDVIAAVYPRAHQSPARLVALIDHVRSMLGDPTPWDRDIAAAGIILPD